MEYQPENKQCQNCKKDFTIEPDDFTFYEKIKVPPPTFCPECRMIRRMAFRDYRVLYKRKSDYTGEIIFSIFHQKSPVKVWERDIWWSDKWDSLDYGKDYDFNKSFFPQLKELFINVPLPSHTVWDMINSEYCTGANNLKDCYLVFVSTYAEDSMYSAEINRTKSSIDVNRIESSELCYQSFALTKCYKTFFSSNCENCMDVWFSRDLVGCNSCFGCTNLRNKQYFIFNKKYSKDDYEKLIRGFNIGSYESIEKIKEKTNEIINKSVRKYMEGHYNSNVSGEYINNSKNVFSSYYVTQAEDCKYLQCFFTPSVKSCYDCTLWGGNTSLCYECSSVGSDSYDIKFSCRCSKSSKNCEYSFYCNGCSDIFGCSGLRNKQYCIMNKQYTKEEYFKLREKIIKHMNDMPYVDNKGMIYRYGEFFPTELSPNCYNESLAQDYFPLKKKQAIEQGYNWIDVEERNYLIDIKNEDIEDDIKDINDEIVGKVIECKNKGKVNEQCTLAFKIIEPEFQFYKRMNLPIPRLCPNCRYFERIKMRNSIKLWHRKCMKEGCNNEFETSYAPERPEIVYCERCYQNEVY